MKSSICADYIFSEKRVDLDLAKLMRSRPSSHTNPGHNPNANCIRCFLIVSPAAAITRTVTSMSRIPMARLPSRTQIHICGPKDARTFCSTVVIL